MPVIDIKTVAHAAHLAGFSGNDLAIAIAVANAESGFNTDAVNHNPAHGKNPASDDLGLWQINSYWNATYLKTNWRDPYGNAQMAYAIWKDAGWKDWVAYTNGRWFAYYVSAKSAADYEEKGIYTPPVSTSTLPDAGVVSTTTPSVNMNTLSRVGMVLGGAVLVVIGSIGLSGQSGKIVSLATKGAL